MPVGQLAACGLAGCLWGPAGCLWPGWLPVAWLAACGTAGCLWHSRMPVAQSDAYGTAGCLWDSWLPVGQSDACDLEGCLWHSRMPATQEDACDIVGFRKARFSVIEGCARIRDPQDERSESVGLAGRIGGCGFLALSGATQNLRICINTWVFAATQRNSSATHRQLKCTLQLSCNSVSCS